MRARGGPLAPLCSPTRRVRSVSRICGLDRKNARHRSRTHGERSAGATQDASSYFLAQRCDFRWYADRGLRQRDVETSERWQAVALKGESCREKSLSRDGYSTESMTDTGVRFVISLLSITKGGLSSF